MSDYTKESISNLLFEKVDAILIVDAPKDNYHVIKKSGLFQDILEDNGSYEKLIEKLISMDTVISASLVEHEGEIVG